MLENVLYLLYGVVELFCKIRPLFEIPSEPCAFAAQRLFIQCLSELQIEIHMNDTSLTHHLGENRLIPCTMF